MGWDAEEFAGVGALHFSSDRESGDVDELMFLSEGAVDEAWAACDWGSEGEFGGGCGGDGWGCGLGFDGCRSRSGFRLWLGGGRGGGSYFWGLDGFWLGYRGGSWSDLWFGFGGGGDLRSGRCGSRSGDHFWSDRHGLEAGVGRGWSGFRLDDWSRLFFGLQFGLGLGHHLRAGQDGRCLDCRGGNGELALGVGADDFGAGGHAANVNEAWGVGEGGANVALEAGHGIGGWRGGFLNRSGGGAGEIGLSWGLDPVGIVVGGQHGVGLSLRGGHAVLHEGDQAVALNLAPSVAWGEAAGGERNGGEQTDDE